MTYSTQTWVPRSARAPRRRRRRPGPAFGERHSVTGSVLTLCWLSVLGLTLGAAVGSVLVLVVRLVLDLAASLAVS